MRRLLLSGTWAQYIGLNQRIEILPRGHPAKAPYHIFQQAGDKVRGGVIIGLGARLQVFQNASICDITAQDDFDLSRL